LKIDAYSKAADLSNAHQAHEHFNPFQGQMWVNIPYIELLEKNSSDHQQPWNLFGEYETRPNE
jgi:hypothetical protein